MRKHLVILLSIAALCGCATTGASTGADGLLKIDGPIQIGDGLYKLGGPGNTTDSSGTAVKVRFMQQATTFCSSRGLAMAPGKSTTKDASAGARASAEIQFRCIAK